MPLIDAKTLAAALNLSSKFVRRLAQKGAIPGEKYGSEWRFDLDRVRAAAQYVDPIKADAQQAARRVWMRGTRRRG